MSRNEIKKKLRIGTIALWIILGIITIVMIALFLGDVFSVDEFWIPIISIGCFLILAIVATIVDIVSERKIKIGIVGIWTLFALTCVVFIALIIGDVFHPDDYWIPIIPLGTLLTLAIVSTILEYTAGEVKYCPKCGTVFAKKGSFCQECGTRILMTCPSCGMKIKGNPKFCVKCGINLSEKEIRQTYSPRIKFKYDGYAEICNQCGAPNKPDAKYCAFCGTRQ